MPLPQPGPDRTAIVTGASSGIGVELARDLVRRGHGVTLVARSVLSYTEALNDELRGTGVSASVLCPGPVDTGFGERAGFDKAEAEAALPSIMWLSAEDVAKQGIEGLAKGRVVTVPGAANRIAARVSRLAPNRVLLPIMARQHPGLR